MLKLFLSCCLLLSTWAHAAPAAEAPFPIAVAESESFEAVGRLEAEGMRWFIDRADTNAPVLGAMLEVEFGGKTAKAVYRAERGDYLIADAGWLAPLRAIGEHDLVLTLIVGEESDLLTAELHVDANDAGNGDLGGGRGIWIGLAGAVLGAVVWWRRQRRKGGEA